MSIEKKFDEIKTIRLSIKNTFKMLTEKHTEIKEQYKKYIDSNKKNELLDSFYFQIKIMNYEYENTESLYHMIDNRMYCDYYKLFIIVYNYFKTQFKEEKSEMIIKNSKYPVYKDLDQLKRYDFDTVNDIHQDIIRLIDYITKIINQNSDEIKAHQIKVSNGLNIDNYIFNLEYNNNLIVNNVSLYRKYLSAYHKYHSSFLSNLNSKLNLILEQLKNDVNFTEPIKIPPQILVKMCIQCSVKEADYCKKCMNEEKDEYERFNILRDSIQHSDAYINEDDYDIVNEEELIMKEKGIHNIIIQVNQQIIEEVNQPVIEEVIEEVKKEEEAVIEEKVVEPVIEDVKKEELINEPVIEEKEVFNEHVIEEVKEEDKTAEVKEEEVINEPIINEQFIEEVKEEEDKTAEVKEEVINEPIINEHVIEEVKEEDKTDEVIEEKEENMNQVVNEPVIEEVKQEVVIEEVKQEVVNEPVIEEVKQEVINEQVIEEVINELIINKPVIEQVIVEDKTEEVKQEIINEPVIKEVNDELDESINIKLQEDASPSQLPTIFEQNSIIESMDIKIDNTVNTDNIEQKIKKTPPFFIDLDLKLENELSHPHQKRNKKGKKGKK